jgi:hypothetical protein
MNWNGTNKTELKVPSGAYIYEIQVSNLEQTNKMMLAK